MRLGTWTQETRGGDVVRQKYMLQAAKTTKGDRLHKGTKKEAAP